MIRPHAPFDFRCEAIGCTGRKPRSGQLFCLAHYKSLPRAFRFALADCVMHPVRWEEKRRQIIAVIAFAEKRISRKEAREIIGTDPNASAKANDATLAAILLALAAGKGGA